MKLPFQRPWQADEYWNDVVAVMSNGKRVRKDAYLDMLDQAGLDALRCALALPGLEAAAAAAPPWPAGKWTGRQPSTQLLSEIGEACRQVDCLLRMKANDVLNMAAKKEAKRLGLRFTDQEMDELMAIYRQQQMARMNSGLEVSPQAIGALLKRADQNFDRLKFQRALQTKMEAGLDEIAAAFQANPRALELYRQARALIAQELTPP